ncbi:hypothetical protein JTE90_015106 [Oedothorax gibbosus]|uniref:Acetoacetyl-CoA synthetase n=1 Tax=Oedothorax gibbosus TaxID=931172 RepID=A0AAV6VQ80_9ARAC|nr:hypothetical protein JTE90_015106 [Oedothorax gibbosus]
MPPVQLSHSGSEITGVFCDHLKDAKTKAEKSREKVLDYLTWDKTVPNTEIEKFKKIIEDKFNLKFGNYWDFHKWTVDNFASFWEEVWMHFGIVFSKPHDEVFIKTGPGFLDNKWFTGAEFNYAENILRIRDNREALVCIDEKGNTERVTFAKLFEEVKLYAAAFRKHGLQKGDRVACYMSNRKEAVYAMLAAISIGAIWGGPQPYFGARAAANIIEKLEARFLIVVESVENEYTAEEDSLIENLPYIAERTASLECIIVVPTQNETLRTDISHIPKSCTLGDFLESGRTADGLVPDIVFEQLPFDYPVSISFSSGTTGLPKGPVHSAGSLLGPLVDFGLHYNLKSGDTIYSFYPMGWSLWNYMVAALSLGVRLVLHSGSPYSRDVNVWDVMAQHKASFTFLVTSIVDRMEKLEVRPEKHTNFERLKFVMVGGSPVKLQNYKFLKSIVKENTFIGNLYGSTETFGSFSGTDLNTPGYANEVQVPALGRDLQVFDKRGEPVFSKRGELVVTKPSPTFPTGLWRDENNEVLNRTYFSNYPGVWQQHDEGFINPRTKGFVVLGRSDDTLIQNGERFGSSDIYFAIHGIEEIEDYICVGQNKSNGENRALLFLKLKQGFEFTPEFRERVVKKIETELWIDCVPEVILPVEGIPYNVNNKRVESLIRKIVATNQIPESTNIKNPECLKDYCDIPEIFNYNDD